MNNENIISQTNTHEIRAIIFDCDGTLVDSEYTHYLAWQYAVQNQGSDLPIDEYFQYVGKSSAAIANALAKKIDKDHPEKIRHDKKNHYRQLHSKGLPPIQSTVDFVHKLVSKRKELGIQLAVASAAPKEEILANLKDLEIDTFFEVILSGSDDLTAYIDPEGVNKPKPYIYLHAAKLLGVAPSQCVVIEDTHTGITAGADAGCITVAVPNKYTYQHDFSRAHLKIASFAELSIEDFLEKIIKLRRLDICENCQ